jgi:large subunit ribosomal protein L23
MKQKNRFSFAVDSKAEKMSIKFAMEKLFEVKVVSVNTSMLALKKRCVGKIIGKKVRYKRAIIKLGAEDTIRFLDMFYYENPII